MREENEMREVDTLAVKKKLRNFIILLVVFCLALGIFFYLGNSFLEAWPIIGTSMESTIHNGDKVLLVKTKKVDYDDIIIFQIDTGNSDTFQGKHLIKRVIGKEGDLISIRYSATDCVYHVYRNGEIVDESHINAPMLSTYSPMEVTVPEGKLFVLGDNRNISHDSHIAGFFADVDNIVGKVFVRYTAITDMEFV